MGVRIEHPQPLIDRIQYGAAAGHPKLPAAAYRLAQTIDGRGVFSFCMCPGGWIVPAATEPDGVVVNGMSLSRRDSPFANSGLVVSVEPADFARAAYRRPLGGVALQRAARARGARGRRRACCARRRRARPTSSRPRVDDRAGVELPARSRAPATSRAVLDATGLPLAASAARGARRRSIARCAAISPRTPCSSASSRARARRCACRATPTTLESPDFAGLYPCGEGAGYAGGIVSAALDGMRVADKIAERL